jgi:uncharacterized protein
MPLELRKTTTRGLNTSPESGSEASSTAIRARVDGVDWTKVHADLDVQGWVTVPKLLTCAEADFIAGRPSSFGAARRAPTGPGALR